MKFKRDILFFYIYFSIGNTFRQTKNVVQKNLFIHYYITIFRINNDGFITVTVYGFTRNEDMTGGKIKGEDVLVKVKTKSDIGFWQYKILGILSLFMERGNDYLIITDKRILTSNKENISKK